MLFISLAILFESLLISNSECSQVIIFYYFKFGFKTFLWMKIECDVTDWFVQNVAFVFEFSDSCHIDNVHIFLGCGNVLSFRIWTFCYLYRVDFVMIVHKIHVCTRNPRLWWSYMLYTRGGVCNLNLGTRSCSVEVCVITVLVSGRLQCSITFLRRTIPVLSKYKYLSRIVNVRQINYLH